MRFFGRRKAVTGIAAAPLALTVTGTNQYGARVVEKLNTPPGAVPFDLGRIAEPAGLKSYYAAVENAHKGWNFFDARRDLQRYRGAALSPNIACLKSVSAQHKYIMHMREVDRYHEERKTALEKLLDTFGVRDYFKKLEDRHGSALKAESSARY